VSVIDRVHELVEPVLAGQGLELADVDFAGATLRVFVDQAGGVDLEAITAATRVVSEVLDAHPEVVPGRYTLEVSSPGVERTLRRPEHFARFVGTPVAVRTHPAVEGERRVEGTLVSADEEGIVVGDRHLAYSDIERARTVFVWGPVPAATPRGKKKAAKR
jgi:ribosome maturation factor RimP